MKKILITGFGSFGDVDVNPSELLVSEIVCRDPFGEDVDLSAEILPVVYDEAVTRIQSLIRTIQPDILISFGVAARRDKVCPERVAVNLKDTQLPDNAGNTPDGELLIEGAPLAYFSNMPLTELRELLEDADIPVEISNHAGAYICNAVFFAAAHEIESQQRGILFDFIHIPLIPSDAHKLTIEKLAEGVEAILLWLLQQRPD